MPVSKRSAIYSRCNRKTTTVCVTEIDQFDAIPYKSIQTKVSRSRTLKVRQYQHAEPEGVVISRGEIIIIFPPTHLLAIRLVIFRTLVRYISKAAGPKV